MALHQSPFRFAPVGWLFLLANLLLTPYLSSLSGLLSLFIPTTPESKYRLRNYTKRLVFAPLYAACVLLSLPIAAPAFILRCFLHMFRRPYLLTVHKTPLSNSFRWDGHCLSVATANICLLPEFLSRINNFSGAGNRARTIGERIIIDQLFYGTSGKVVRSPVIRNGMRHQATFATGIETHFGAVHFLCLQEIWVYGYSRKLRQELHKVYPYILSDVGVTSWQSNRFLLNSGLMFASRFPILDAHFEFFPHSVTHCNFCAMGLLMVKVSLQTEDSDGDAKPPVGYIHTTHLQSFQGPHSVLGLQMDCIRKWAAEFREKTHKKGERVLFDIICGDFNFDNMSPGEKEYSENQLLEEYEDPANACPGLDHPWTIGTEMRPLYFWEEDVSTPELMKAAFQDPVKRQRYLIDADVEMATVDNLCKRGPKTDAQGNPILSPVGGKRRIDFILHRRSTPIVVEEYKFITRLATLTDHIPVSMTFRAGR